MSKPDTTRHPLTGKQRIIAGAIGGALPILLNLAKYEPGTLFLNFSPQTFLGYCVTDFLFACFGGIVGYYLAEGERAVAVLMMGMGAPATLAGLLVAKEVNPPQQRNPTTVSAETSPEASLRLGIDNALDYRVGIRTALATERYKGKYLVLAAASAADRSAGIKEIRILKVIPADGAFDAFLRGIVGAEQRTVFMVSAGNFSGETTADNRRKELQTALGQHNPALMVKVVNSPFKGSGDRNYLLISDRSVQKGKPPQFMLNELKPLVFTDEEEAKRTAEKVANALSVAKEIPIIRYVE